eukprot:TRINITY_DN4192_c0_g1_i1.p1 TRINITY_DN4192_c0_g1~~TRINITY_DN4192_c0_g1_i1.p1  ORF type:complete len:720 (-),score=154.48 TRINITY_DN4192_c0_g1_i1:1638-3797(-)
MEKLLNFKEPLDVGLLEAVLNALYTSQNATERAEAQKIIGQFQEHPDAWMTVDTILEQSKNTNVKFFSLLVLESTIKYRWKSLPREQCEGIKNYIVNLIIRLSSDATSLQKEKLLLNKLNMTLVQIVKQEWPQQWPSFIPDIVGSSKSSPSLCENNMSILKLLSEEVFDFSSGQMTQAKIVELKQSLNKEFALIYELCEWVLENAQIPSLLVSTLETLLRFLNWIPVGYIFGTKMIDNLISKFLPVAITRNLAMQCLTEIGSLSIEETYNSHFVRLYTVIITQLCQIIPESIVIEKVYENDTEEGDQKFIQNIALFLCGFFKAHLPLLEKINEMNQMLIEGHKFLVRISRVEDVEVFKICLEYWGILAAGLYNENPHMPAAPLLLSNISVVSSPRRQMYSVILSAVRNVMISRMAKPEEVLIVEDENGEIIREIMKDSDAIILYKSMKEVLVYLTHLDYEDTQNIMLEKLSAQEDGSEWSWHGLNTLCWAIGSISGAMNEEQEKRFLVYVIKDLLTMVEHRHGKDNKAVIASDIMYVVGQYPRFLRAHWKFLKTVVNKLFEFMHETHPGVQDMACDTFLKISQKCKRKFVVVQPGESVAFVEEILQNTASIIADLEDQQKHTFYEAIGYMISSRIYTDPKERDELIAKFMFLPNDTWGKVMAEVGKNVQTLLQPETIKIIANILKTNCRAALSLGWIRMELAWIEYIMLGYRINQWCYE